MASSIKNVLTYVCSIIQIFRNIKVKVWKSKTARGLIKLIKFPYTYYPGGTSSEVIFNDYYMKLNEGKENNIYPIMVRCDPALLSYLKSIRKYYSADEIINVSRKSKVSAKRVLDRKFKLNFFENRRMYHINLEEFTGKKVKNASQVYFTSLQDFSNKDSILETLIFEVQTFNPWEIFAYIPFCTDDDFPNPNELLKIGKHWYKEYQAIPSIIGYNTLEMFLLKPISKEKSLDVSKELFALLPDLVNRGTNSRTLMELANTLEKSYVWFFFWDQSNINKLLNDMLVKELWRRKKRK